jgi:hypothetical protein
MSKAGPRPVEAPEVVDRWDKRFAKLREKSDAGPWEHESTIDLIVMGDATLIREGRRRTVTGAVRFRRLDVLVAGDHPLVLSHRSLGAVIVPQGTALTAWNLPRFLGTNATLAIDELVARAAKCDQPALDELARILPAAHAAVRAHDTPEMKLLLTLFDE